MKSAIFVLAIVVVSATAQLVAPPFRDFHNGLWVAVYEKNEEGQQYPKFEVVFLNPTRDHVTVTTMIHSFLPQMDGYGMLDVDSKGVNGYPKIRAAFDDLLVSVAPMQTQTFVITKKIFSGGSM